MSKPKSLKTDFRAADRWLVVALNLGPLAALSNLMVSYALAPESCMRGSKLILHLSAAAFFVVALSAAFIAKRMVPPPDPELHERTLWLANAAVGLAIASAVLIVAMEIPNLILRSCD